MLSLSKHLRPFGYAQGTFGYAQGIFGRAQGNGMGLSKDPGSEGGDFRGKWVAAV